MNNPTPYYLFDIKEKKLIFYNTYLPEYISIFKKYISELQLCLDYNYINNLNSENKSAKLIEFFTKIFATFQCQKVVVAKTSAMEVGTKQLTIDFIKFWINKFNGLSESIKESIIEKSPFNVNISKISESIGHLTHLQNILDNNTSPYYDYSNFYTQLNIPVGSAVYSKLPKNILKAIITAEYKTNIILKHNIKSVQNKKVELLEGPTLKTGFTYASLAHGDNLITDSKTNFSMYSIVDALNGVLAVNLNIMYDLVKQYSDINSTTKKYKVEKMEFTSVDNEGENYIIDVYGNNVLT